MNRSWEKAAAASRVKARKGRAAPTVDSLFQADGGPDPLSPATAACKHAELARGVVGFGPFPGRVIPSDYVYVDVPGWQCTACGSGFGEPLEIDAVMKRSGLPLTSTWGKP